MSGSGYRKRYIKILGKGSVGHHTSDNKELTLRHVGQGQEASVPWVAGCICYEVGQGNHTCDAKRRRSKRLGVVSASPLCEIGRRNAAPSLARILEK